MRLRYKLAAAASLLLSATSAQAGIPIVWSNGDHISLVDKLPERPEFTFDNQHYDLGTAYGEFSLFWMPLWGWEKENYVLYREQENGDYSYVPVDKNMLGVISRQTHRSYDPQPFALWKHLWGWLVLAVVLGGFVLIGRSSEQR